MTVKWKLAGAALGIGAIGLAVPVAAAQPGNNNGHSNPNPSGQTGANAPGQSVASVARNGGGPSGVLGVLQSLHSQAPGLTTALSHVPTTVPPTTTDIETTTTTTTATETTTSKTTTTITTTHQTTTVPKTP